MLKCQWMHTANARKVGGCSPGFAGGERTLSAACGTTEPFPMRVRVRVRVRAKQWKVGMVWVSAGHGRQDHNGAAAFRLGNRAHVLSHTTLTRFPRCRSYPSFLASSLSLSHTENTGMDSREGCCVPANLVRSFLWSSG